LATRQQGAEARQACGDLILPRHDGGVVPSGKRGRQPDYTDAAVQTCLMMKALFGMVERLTTRVLEFCRPTTP
jgi:hypothetical protein